VFYKNINIFCCVSFLRTNFIKKILKKYILLLFIFNITKYNSQKIFSRIQTRCFLWRCILMKKNIFQVNMLGQKVDPLFPPSSYRNGPSSYWNTTVFQPSSTVFPLKWTVFLQIEPSSPKNNFYYFSFRILH